MDNRERFEIWLKTTTTERTKKSSTAYNYASAIRRIHENYRENTGVLIDFFTCPIEQLEEATSLYSLNGKFSEFGKQGKGTIRNALNSLLRYRKSPEILITEIEDIEDDEEAPNFHYENDLQETILFQLNDLFPDYKIFGKDNEEGIKYRIGGKEIDILLESNDGNSLLILELKANKAREKVYGQIAMYFGLLKTQFPEKDIRGIIIAQEISDELLNAGILSDKISFMSYLLEVKLTEVTKPKI